MSVRANVAFGLEMRGERGIDAKVGALLAKLRLSEFAERFPKDLSGGMRQRVAIARVLALDSPILLMDEPFGALDALTRRNLQDELLRIWTELGKTILFVTHSIDESIHLADRVVVMTYRPGRVKAIVPVTIARPRDSASPEFNELKRTLSAMVMEEQRRSEEDELMAAG
jgi:NitT/TauT family transport system ATP-binding protein